MQARGFCSCLKFYTARKLAARFGFGRGGGCKHAIGGDVVHAASGQTSGAVLVRDTGNATAAVLNGTIVNDVRPALDDCVAATASTVTMTGLNVGGLLNQKGITWGWFQGNFAPVHSEIY
jgi:hypothetical protein